MKYVGVAEAKAKLSECIDAAQREPVVILSHGRPAAMVVGLTGMSLDDVAHDDAQLLKLLTDRSRSATVPWHEAKAQLASTKAPAYGAKAQLAGESDPVLDRPVADFDFPARAQRC